MGSASNRKSVDWSSTLLSRPSGGLADFMAHGRSPGLRRIADAAFPDFKSSGEKRVGTPFTVAGAATDQRRSLPCSLFTLGCNRGTMLAVYVPASKRVVKWSASPSLRRGGRQTSKKGRPGLRRADLRAVWEANLEARTTFAAPTTLSCSLPRPLGSESGRRHRPPLDGYPRRTALRRIDAPFRAAAARERPEASPRTAPRRRKRNIWR
jgi:hypothetical protein